MWNKKMQTLSVPVTKIRGAKMPRKRMIDSAYWSDEEVGMWSSDAKLFYIGLWNFADDEGRFRAVPKLLKAQIFPYSDIDMEQVIDETKSKIQYYEDRGQKYGWVKNFKKHQYLSKKIPSRLPAPPSVEEGNKRIEKREAEPVPDSPITTSGKRLSPAKERFDNFFTTITDQEKKMGNLAWLAINKCIKMKVEKDEKSRRAVIVWIRTYPKLNVPLEISKADAWLLTHGKENKNGVTFFNNWLNIASTYQTRDAAIAGRGDDRPVSIPSNESEFNDNEGEIGTGNQNTPRTVTDI